MVHRPALLVVLLLLGARPVGAEPLRVLSASEVAIEPRVYPDRSALGVRVRVRDDHGAAVQGRVELLVTPEGGAAFSTVRHADERGEADFRLPLTGADRVFALQASFAGAEGVAGARAEARVDLDAPFITLDLRVAPVVDLDAPTLDAFVSIGVGAVVALNPQGLEVALLADGRLLATALADATGRVAFRTRVADLGAPGVRTLRAEHQRGAAVLRSPDRRVVVRAHTSLTLARSGATADAVHVVGALATRVGPVLGAPVRILWGQQVLGAGLTDERGTFAVTLDPDVAARPDTVVRAVFAPSEPWYLGAESAPLRLAPPAPRRVPWTLAASPALAALVVLGALWLRRRAVVGEARGALRPIGDAPVERVADAPGGVARVRLVVVDRASGEPVDGARAAWTTPPASGERAADDAVDVPGGGRFAVEVRAPGFAPRALSGELPRGGEYALRVPLRTWREELFDRLRRKLRRSASGPVLPTPREYLAARPSEETVARLVLRVEAGAYGPEQPDAATVGEVDDLARAAAPSRAQATAAAVETS